MQQPQTKINNKIKFTYSDYLLLPYDTKQYQLIGGDFYMSPAPRIKHQEASGNIYFILKEFVSKHNLGKVYDAPIDVVLSRYDVIQPDILFISKQRLNIVSKRNIKGAPDLVVEILSSRTRRWDMVLKKRLYAKYGVPEYWLVDPDKKTAELSYLTEEGYKAKGTYKGNDTFESDIIKGLKINLKEVF